MIRTRVAAGRLHVLHRGVYSLSPAISERARQWAALLACGPRSVLSHRSAGSIWGILSYPASARAWITVPSQRETARPGIEVRRAKLLRRDVRRRDGLRVTSPPRTVVDLARLLDEELLEHVVAEASFLRLASEAELARQLDRYPNRAGNAAVRRVLGLPGGPQRTRSPGERALLRLLRANGFEGFEANARICGYDVDFLWRELAFAVELDGWDGHKSRTAFERDRLKLARLRAGGISVMPVTGRQLQRDETGVVHRLRAALAHPTRG